jgi:Pentapeptide repeats (8 copies)
MLPTREADVDKGGGSPNPEGKHARMPDRPLLRVPVSRVAQIAGGVLVAAVAAVAALWALPPLLTRHPSSGLTTAERLSAINDVRSVLVTFLLAVGAAGGLLFTARTFRLSRDTQLTDRFSRAVSQIGDGSLEVRIGGIYALERIGRDSDADRRAVVYVLGAMVRHRSRDGRDTDAEPAEDVYAALSAISRQAHKGGAILNLSGADLRNANLRFMYGTQVNLGDADLAGAKLPDDWDALVQSRNQQARTSPGDDGSAATELTAP